ncbi:PfkB family carbohydrate kinase, partial [Nodularia spumigena CS-587/03]|nr:PfkB family carbohydrate kinase [Nodularia spumigena CS-587/03]
MSNPRVLCLGEILFDCLADQLGLTLEEVKSWTPYPGGAPANVACALVKLGTPSGFIGA